MSRTTKDPIALARAALEAGKQALASYSHPKSPHKFTQPQLLAILVLKQFFKSDYRGMAQMFNDFLDLPKVRRLRTTPHRAQAQRLLSGEDIVEKRAGGLYNARPRLSYAQVLLGTLTQPDAAATPGILVAA